MRWPVVLILGGVGVFLLPRFLNLWLGEELPLLGPLLFWGGIALVIAGVVMDRRSRPAKDMAYRPAWTRFWLSTLSGAVGAFVAFRIGDAWGLSLYAAWALGAALALAGAVAASTVPRRTARPLARLDRAVTLWMWVPGFALAWLLLWFFSLTAEPTAAG